MSVACRADDRFQYFHLLTYYFNLRMLLKIIANIKRRVYFLYNITYVITYVRNFLRISKHGFKFCQNCKRILFLCYYGEEKLVHLRIYSSAQKTIVV